MFDEPFLLKPHQRVCTVVCLRQTEREIRLDQPKLVRVHLPGDRGANLVRYILDSQLGPQAGFGDDPDFSDAHKSQLQTTNALVAEAQKRAASSARCAISTVHRWIPRLHRHSAPRTLTSAS
jgi:hypothetical protein